MEKKNDVIVVAGGAGGIGSAICKKFYDKGCKIIILDINKETAKNLCDKYNDFDYYYCDITQYQQIDKVAKDIEKKYGSITHLINAAGRAIPGEFGSIENVKHDVIDDSIKLNLTSHIYLINIFVKLLEKNTNPTKSIILISSINAIRTFGLPVYSAAKSGIYGIVKGMCKDLGRKGIRINAVSPGTVVTELTKNEGKNFDNYLKCCLLGKFPETKEIADAVYTFAYRLPSVTAQFLTIDAGQSMFLPDLD